MFEPERKLSLVPGPWDLWPRPDLGWWLRIGSEQRTRNAEKQVPVHANGRWQQPLVKRRALCFRALWGIIPWHDKVSASHTAASLQQIGTRWGRSTSRYQGRSIRIELRSLAVGARSFPMHNAATFKQGW